MINIDWSLPADLFAGVNRLLASLPSMSPVEIKIENAIEDLVSNIDLGGFTMQTREITDQELKSLTSRLAEGASLTFKGKAVAIYIEDKTNLKPTNDPDKLPKVHITNCGMVDKNPGRYVMVTNPDGRFNVVFSDGLRRGDRRRVPTNLAICKLCKKCLKSKKKGLIGKFSLNGQHNVWDKAQWLAWNRFIASQATQIRDYNTECEIISPNFGHEVVQAGVRSATSMGYTQDWPQISTQLRQAANWTCSDCGVFCGGLRHFLDVHHRNRNKQDNTDANLQVLCKLCHREQGFKVAQDDHELLVTSDFTKWKSACSAIQEARRAQGIIREIPQSFKL
jgi:5-methylcytosine-specific restriction endonuclease McrA